jgi:hypothetical protein
MEATCSSQTSFYNKPTQCHIPEDGILHSHRRENLKSYVILIDFIFNLLPHSIMKQRPINLYAHVSDIHRNVGVNGDSNIKQEVFGRTNHLLSFHYVLTQTA